MSTQNAALNKVQGLFSLDCTGITACSKLIRVALEQETGLGDVGRAISLTDIHPCIEKEALRTVGITASDSVIEVMRRWPRVRLHASQHCSCRQPLWLPNSPHLRTRLIRRLQICLARFWLQTAGRMSVRLRRSLRTGSPNAVTIRTPTTMAMASRRVCIAPSETSNVVARAAGCPAFRANVTKAVRAADMTAAHMRSGETTPVARTFGAAQAFRR